MNKLKTLLTLLPLSLISTGAFAVEDTRVFAYAEAKFPSLFAGSAASGIYLEYNYRCYTTTRYCLAVKAGTIFMVGPNPGDSIVAIGPVSAFANQITDWESGAPGKSITISTIANGLSLPTYVTGDSKGNLYVTNFNNSTVSKITPDGNVSVFASGLRGTGIVADTADNLYVADYSAGAVKKISQNGTVSTLASGIAQPQGITIDRSGNLYVSEWVGGTIKKVTPSGEVSRFASGFYGPSGMAFDGAGNLYVADTYNHAIRKVNAQGVVSTLAGKLTTSGNADGNGTTARFQKPFALTVEAGGTVYVTDTDNHTIRKITPTGEVSTIAGLAGSSGYADGDAGTARFNAPRGPYLDGAGNLYIADASNDRVRKLRF